MSRVGRWVAVAALVSGVAACSSGSGDTSSETAEPAPSMTATSMTTSPSSTSSGPRTTSTTASPSSRIPAPEDLPASFGEWERLRATDSVAVYRNEEGDLIHAAAVHGSPDRTAAYEENVTIGDHVCGELQGTWQCLADLDGVTYVVAADEGYSASEVSDMLTELLTTIEEDAQ